MFLLLSYATATTYTVDGVHGDDANDGITAPFASISKATASVSAGDEIVIEAGTYYETPILWNVEGVWIHARTPGTVVISGMSEDVAEGDVTWTSEGDGIWSTPHGPALFGSWEGVFLFRLNDLADLEDELADDILVPRHGFAHEAGTLYVRLPGDVDPNGEPVLFSTPGYGESGTGNVMEIYRSKNTILDGITFAGSGTNCVWFDDASEGALVRNSAFEYCVQGLRLDDESVVEWSEYGYPGFHDFAEEVMVLNGNWKPYETFRLVKEYHPTNALEGALATSTWRSPRTPSVDCEFRYNFLHETFDSERLGSFEHSWSHDNAYLYAYDNHVEFEDWAGSTGDGLVLSHSRILAGALGPVSHQGSGITGEQLVAFNVISGHDDHGWGSWTMIKSDAPNAGGIYYVHNTIEGGGQSLYYDPDNLTFVNNLLLDVGSWDVAEVVAAGNAESEEEAIDAGICIPEIHPHCDVDWDAGAFPEEEDPGADWPRPFETTYDCSVPDGFDATDWDCT